MVMYVKQGDVQVKLLGVAYVPGVHFNLFSLHAIMPKCSVSLDAKGLHMCLMGFCYFCVGTLGLM